MAAEASRLLPAAGDHVIAALDDLVEVRDLVSDVVDPGLVRAVRQQQRVLILIALGLHERAHVEQLVGDTETQALGVEGDGLLPACRRDEEGDMAEAVGVRAAQPLERLVPAALGPGGVDAAVPELAAGVLRLRAGRCRSRCGRACGACRRRPRSPHDRPRRSLAGAAGCARQGDRAECMTEVNRPDVLRDMALAFERYERAFQSNDLEVLDELFWSDERVVRFGVAEDNYGIDAVRSFRDSQPTDDLERTLTRTTITTFGDCAATAFIEFRRLRSGLVGRQSQTWIRTDAGWRVVAAHVSHVGQQSA